MNTEHAAHTDPSMRSVQQTILKNLWKCGLCSLHGLYRRDAQLEGS